MYWMTLWRGGRTCVSYSGDPMQRVADTAEPSQAQAPTASCLGRGARGSAFDGIGQENPTATTKNPG